MNRSSIPVASLVIAAVCGAARAGDPPVQVIVDMDAATPGIQSTVTVAACTEVVEDVAVFVRDPLGTRTFYSIGYVGAIDRGIAFGHVPDDANAGAVTDVFPTIGTPVHPDNVYHWVTPFVDPAFAGPEVQYVEGASSPGVIPAFPAGPIFTADITLTGAQPGDAFAFHLFDFCSVWPSYGLPSDGSFSTQNGGSRDTGGDAVPDGTPSLYGIDADTPTPLPQAAFLVDYIDGPGGARIIVIAHPADVDGDGAVGVDDLVAVITEWGQPGGPADVNGDGTVDVNDLVAVVTAWGSCG